ncbi:MAG: hypothetical protein AAF570_29475, partial [Bacteroidota bacterium]
MSFTFANLGLYNKYSYAVRIRNGIVFAGQDRATASEYDVQAAFWNGSWTLLPDPATGVLSSVATSGTSTRICGGYSAPGFEHFGRAIV